MFFISIKKNLQNTFVYFLGTGKKGGMMSVFLMGCLDNRRNRWVTVTKVHTGHDDPTLERLQKELAPLMVKISQEYTKLPTWLDCNKGMVPDFVAKDPKNQPVWEITGLYFNSLSFFMVVVSPPFFKAAFALLFRQNEMACVIKNQFILQVQNSLKQTFIQPMAFQ